MPASPCSRSRPLVDQTPVDDDRELSGHAVSSRQRQEQGRQQAPSRCRKPADYLSSSSVVIKPVRDATRDDIKAYRDICLFVAAQKHRTPNLQRKLPLTVLSWPWSANWPVQETPSEALAATAKSRPASATSASRAIGEPAKAKAAPPDWNASAATGVISPSACRQPSVPRAVSVPSAPLRRADPAWCRSWRAWMSRSPPPRRFR